MRNLKYGTGVPAVVQRDWRCLGSTGHRFDPNLVQWVRDLVLPQLRLISDPWPRNSVCHGAAKKENIHMAQMNLSTQQKQTHRHGEQTCGCQGGRGREWDGWGVWVHRCKLLHLEWISSGVLLYSTGNYIQSFGIDYHAR